MTSAWELVEPHVQKPLTQAVNFRCLLGPRSNCLTLKLYLHPHLKQCCCFKSTLVFKV